ncbi:MAG: 2-C-methyl-D-erythritol 4-phosphate cytidylyltransferase [Acidobacteria bacterium]|nr:2-C-methyl-D-erythritol 4-phosphate cytidylyltransferase [Acidobacteriota bacterium]
MYVTAIIVAAGRGRRFGGRVPKLLLTIGGRSLLELSVAAYAAHPEIGELVVALPSELVADPPDCLRAPVATPIRIVAGGARRQDSVANAFRTASGRAEVIVIHDAARPFASAALISRTIAAAAVSGAAVAAVPARDTVKRGSPDPRGAGMQVAETIPRESIFLAQTPQAFRRAVLVDALAAGETAEATDEASLAERAGHRVAIVDGERTNMKITTPDDLPIAEAIARAGGRPPGPLRTGTGYDLHRLVDGRRLMLGGIEVPAARGALGHSDADVVCHAIADAILGAAALGDIGRHFPDTDPRWKDAPGLDLLGRAAALARERGLAVVNLDATVILQAPRIRDHVDAMRSAIAAAVGVDRSRVSVKGKTNEGVDAAGRGEAIAAHASVLLQDVGNQDA